MKIKRLVFILIGIVLIGFGVGLYSLIYIDEFRLSNLPGFHIGGIDVNNDCEYVNIGPGGIEVRDGDEHVSIGWDGIKVIDGDEKVIVGLDGIDINDGKNNRVNISNLFGWSMGNQKEYNIKEEKTESIDGINSIDISSSFVDIVIKTEDREDIEIKYYGKMKSNVLPRLETGRSGSSLKIELKSGTSHSVSYSDTKLEVIIPSSYNGNFDTSGSSADIDIKNINSDRLIVSTSSGNIGLENITSNTIKLSSSSGDIISKNISGDIEAKSSSGDMSYNINEATGNLDISSSSGDIMIEYDDSASYNGLYNTSTGNLINNGPMSINKANRNSYEFSLGNAEKNLKINTSTGNLGLNYK